MIDLEKITNKITSFISENIDIQAVSYVGSYARAATRESSDLDLVFIVSDPAKY